MLMPLIQISRAALLGMGLVLAACGGRSEPPAAPSPIGATPTPSISDGDSGAQAPIGQVATEPASGDATAEHSGAPIEQIDADGLERLLTANRGRVLVVNLWATWCAPCLHEIPELVRLAESLGPRGLDVVGVSLDDADQTAAVEAFRDHWFPAFETYHASGDWYALVEPLDPNWSSVLPTSFVFDRDGHLAATLTGGQSYERFAAEVEPLL